MPGSLVVEAGNRGELLAAIVARNISAFPGRFFQRFQAIGGEEAGRHHGDAAHPVFRQVCAIVLSV